MKRHFVSRKKRQNGKEILAEMKDRKNGKIWKLYENLNTENFLKSHSQV